MEERINSTICGHVLEVLKTFPDGCINCIVTSPPYYGKRKYQIPDFIWDGDDGCEHEWGEVNKFKATGSKSGKIEHNRKSYRFEGRSNFCIKCNAWKGQLGLEPTYQLYLKHLFDIFRECNRVLKKDGACWVNLGDTYASGNRDTGGKRDMSRLYSKEAKHVGDWHIQPNRQMRDYPQKCLIMIPQRFAIGMVDEVSFILRNEIHWRKRNCMPDSAKDRFTNDYEYFYFFVKNKKYYFEQQLVPYTKDLDRWGGNELNADCGESDYDNNVGHGLYRNRDMRPNEKGKNMRTTWDITTKASGFKHYATFPPELVKIPIEATCPEDGIVLDPFMGVMTTARVCEQLERRWIGIEAGQKYIDMATILTLKP